MIDRFFVREVEIVEPSSTTDRYGGTTSTFASYGTVVQGWLSQTSATEPQSDGRDPLMTTLVLFLPVGTSITGRDRVIVGDHTYTVEGEPYEAWTPTGAHHLEVRLQEVEG